MVVQVSVPVLLIDADVQKTISACSGIMDAGLVAKSIGDEVVVVLYVR